MIFPLRGRKIPLRKAICGPGTSAGACTACATAGTYEYYTGNGGLLDACPKADCQPTCRSGQYREAWPTFASIFVF